MSGNEVNWKDWIYQNAAFRQDYTVSIAGKKEENVLLLFFELCKK